MKGESVEVMKVMKGMKGVEMMKVMKGMKGVER